MNMTVLNMSMQVCPSVCVCVCVCLTDLSHVSKSADTPFSDPYNVQTSRGIREWYVVRQLKK